jgi:DNA-directed RNA polymerase II subunit RPB2
MQTSQSNPSINTAEMKSATNKMMEPGAASANDDMSSIDYSKYIEEPWAIIESYFKGQYLERLVRHQLESYNNLTNYQLNKTIDMFNPMRIVSEEDLDPATGLYSLEVIATFENFNIYRPQIHENNGAIKLMFPQEARLRNFTYASAMTVDISFKYIVRNGEHLQNMQIFNKTFQKIHIGKLPIMLKSTNCVLSQYKHVENTQTGECRMDAGGYFIINGSEKTVLAQERAAENRVYCFNISKNSTKFTYTAEMKSVPDTKCISPKQINMMMSSKNNGFGFPIYIQIPRVKVPLPLFTIFRALSVLTDKEICDRILMDIDPSQYSTMLECLQASVIESNKCMTQEDAMKLLTSNVMYTPINMDKETGALKKREFAKEILKNDLYPHCQTIPQKLFMLGYSANKLLQASLEWIKLDDRDSYVNKRIDLTGTLLNNQFRNYFNKMVKDMEKQIKKEINTGSWRSTDDYENIVTLTNLYKIIKPTTIENGINRALATGDFGIKHNNSNKVGVAQVLNRLTYPSSLSHLRRISTPADKSGKLVPPRKLHNTTWGFICPAETPEGQSVGIVKNLSVMAHISIHTHSNSLYEYISPHVTPIEELFPITSHDFVKVFINGTCIGFTFSPFELYVSIKEKKHKGIINIYTSVIFNYKLKEIRVCNDSGRIMRPLLRVKKNKLIINNEIIEQLKSGELEWNDLFTNCKIPEAALEYIDPEEQSHSLIATTPKELLTANAELKKFTHCEIHPSTLFGVVASCIPFPDHNQSPRNTYQCAQSKQALGVYATNYNERMDKTAYVLNNPTRPLVETRIMNMIRLNDIPSGCNITVAIMTHTGYNQEDSLLINKGSIDRGLFQATIYHTEKDEDKQKINGDEEIRCKPDPSKTKGMKFGNYNKVTSKGVVPENTLVENRDIIIAKVTPIKDNRNDHTKVIKYEDQSKMYRTNEPAYIDKNYIDRNGNGYSFAKVRVRTVCKPAIGDKFSSRAGQKGTCGNIIPEEDMPFTKDGVRPDIIINPHAIPSRMTIGQLKEMLLGRVLVELGLFGDGTSFGDLAVSSISEKLAELGFESNCNEILYNGLTGEQFESDIFMGPVFYQRLKHMVRDKQHSRSIGPMVNLTRQPAEGRSRDGGLRFGEMERDCTTGDTLIGLSFGRSIKIQEMTECGYSVLGWSDEKNGLVPALQSGFMDKGVKECFQLTFEDGRKVVYTDNHPLLTSAKEWVRVKDLVINETAIKSSVTYPTININEEMQQCAGWSLQAGSLLLTTNTPQEYLKTLAFASILGYLVTDGHIYRTETNIYGKVFLGHPIDVKTFNESLKLFSKVSDKLKMTHNTYYLNIDTEFISNIASLEGITIGAKINQHSELPAFILDENCPEPIVREFLAGVFGGDGHTCVLPLHRGKRDMVTSISISKSKTVDKCESLTTMMHQIQHLLHKCGIHKTTIQNFKEITASKKCADKTNKRVELVLHLDINELIPFSEKIGFRYCCHKSQRLEAGVSYKRLRNEVCRQHNWLVARVDEITNFSKIKADHPEQTVPTKKAILQAVKDLQSTEPLIHEYAVPTAHDITDHLIKGTTFGKFSTKSFPTAEEFFRNIGALSWFMDEPPAKSDVREDDIAEDFVEEEELNANSTGVTYGVNRDCGSIPAMNLKIIDRRPVGPKQVYDIQVDDVHSFLANGIVSHNCMVSHGASRFTRGRLYDASDKFQVHVCKRCGMIAAYNDEVHIHHCKTCDNKTEFSYVEIPYACKLLSQELITMNVAMRIITDH